MVVSLKQGRGSLSAEYSQDGGDDSLSSNSTPIRANGASRPPLPIRRAKPNRLPPSSSAPCQPSPPPTPPPSPPFAPQMWLNQGPMQHAQLPSASLLDSLSETSASTSTSSRSIASLLSHTLDSIRHGGEQWRIHGRIFRSKLLRKDEQRGGSFLVLSNECDIQRYYEVADKVLDQFLTTSIDERAQLAESYLIGNRLVKFLSTVLPTHKDYFSPRYSTAYAQSQEQLIQLLQYMEQLALVIDEEEYNRYILSDLKNQADNEETSPLTRKVEDQSRLSFQANLSSSPNPEKATMTRHYQHDNHFPPSQRSPTSHGVQDMIESNSNLDYSTNEGSPGKKAPSTSILRTTSRFLLPQIEHGSQDLPQTNYIQNNETLDESRDQSRDLSREFDGLIDRQNDETSFDWEAQFVEFTSNPMGSEQETKTIHLDDQISKDEFGFPLKQSGRKQIQTSRSRLENPDCQGASTLRQPQTSTAKALGAQGASKSLQLKLAVSSPTQLSSTPLKPIESASHHFDQGDVLSQRVNKTATSQSRGRQKIESPQSHDLAGSSQKRIELRGPLSPSNTQGGTPIPPVKHVGAIPPIANRSESLTPSAKWSNTPPLLSKELRPSARQQMTGKSTEYHLESFPVVEDNADSSLERVAPTALPRPTVAKPLVGTEWSTQFHSHDPFKTKQNGKFETGSQPASLSLKRKNDEPMNDLWAHQEFEMWTKTDFFSDKESKLSDTSAETSIANSHGTPTESMPSIVHESSPKSVLEFREWRGIDNQKPRYEEQHIIKVDRLSDDCSSIGSLNEKDKRCRAMVGRRTIDRLKGCVTFLMD